MSHRILAGAFLVLLVAALPATATVHAQTAWYVDDDAPADPCPGDPNCGDPLEDGSADHPFDAIQEGIDAATDDDTVLVADGTYTGIGNKNLDYAGKAITVRSEHGAAACTIDCEGDGRGFRFHSGEGPDAIVEGLTITNGNADHGAAVYCEGSSPGLTNCTISDNTAGGSGGAVYCRSSSSPTLTNCTISGNSADYHAGGVSCFKSSPTSTNSKSKGNSSRDARNPFPGRLPPSPSRPTSRRPARARAE